MEFCRQPQIYPNCHLSVFHRASLHGTSCALQSGNLHYVLVPSLTTAKKEDWETCIQSLHLCSDITRDKCYCRELSLERRISDPSQKHHVNRTELIEYWEESVRAIKEVLKTTSSLEHFLKFHPAHFFLSKTMDGVNATNLLAKWFLSFPGSLLAISSGQSIKVVNCKGC